MYFVGAEFKSERIFLIPLIEKKILLLREVICWRLAFKRPPLQKEKNNKVSRSLFDRLKDIYDGGPIFLV